MKKYISKVLFFAMVAVLALIFISPFMVMLLTSFKTNNDAFTIPVRLFPREWVKENYPADRKSVV